MKIKSRAEETQSCYTAYTLDIDSGDTSEIVVIYNTDETLATKRDTYKYLDDFIRCIGGAKKIK